MVVISRFPRLRGCPVPLSVQDFPAPSWLAVVFSPLRCDEAIGSKSPDLREPIVGDGGTDENCCAQVRTVVMPLPAAADAFVFSTGNADNLMATATPPASGSN